MDYGHLPKEARRRMKLEELTEALLKKARCRDTSPHSDRWRTFRTVTALPLSGRPGKVTPGAPQGS